MEVTNIFSTPVYHVFGKKEEESDLEHLRKWALNWEKKYPQGVEKSNRLNGYHSVPTNDMSSIPHSDLLITKIQSLPFGEFQFTFLNWWLNIQHRGSYNVSHNHPGSDLSFIWYLTDNYNSLVFCKPEYHMTRDNLYKAFKNMNNNPFDLEWTWQCSAGDLLIFPSDLLHHTKIHMNKKARICIAGNLSISTN